jgi:hypothetical protein
VYALNAARDLFLRNHLISRSYPYICFVLLKSKMKTKNPMKKLFQGIKSFGLDRIIDIWTLLQPEEERRKREYSPGLGVVEGGTQ